MNTSERLKRYSKKAREGARDLFGRTGTPERATERKVRPPALERETEPLFDVGPADAARRRPPLAGGRTAELVRTAGGAVNSSFRWAVERMRGASRRGSFRHPVRMAAGGALLVVAVLVFLFSFLNFTFGQATHFDAFQKRVYRIAFTGDAEKDVKPLIDEYARTHRGLDIIYSDKDPDIIVGPGVQPGFTSKRLTVVPPLELVAGIRTIRLRDGRYYWFNARKLGFIIKNPDEGVEGLENYVAKQFNDKPVVTVNAVGDIIPGRHVAEKMAKYGVAYPFEKIAPLVRGADIVYGDLECPLTDRVKPPKKGMTFSAPAKTIEGLKMLGLGVVAVANNHSTNFGREAFTDTLQLLSANGIRYCGGGYNYDEAHTPVVMEANGKKFAFLAYNSIVGSLDATANQPGDAWISMEPWNRDNPDHFQGVVDDIKKAKAVSDFVIVGIHWSQEDVYYPSPSMQNLARMATDAGADVVIGSHPHTVQPIEYNGKFIIYSMGNFIFDQMQRDQTREGFFSKFTFWDSYLVKIEMVPYKIYDYARTMPYEGDTGQYLLDKVLKLSGKL